MGAQRIVLVNEEAIAGMKSELHRLISHAVDIRLDSKFSKIQDAQFSLYQAKGIHNALASLDLLDGSNVTAEDIERIEQKQLGILEEKRRTDRPKWKS